MSKFHINKHGVPAPCKAKSGNCPLGGMESHYDSQEEAQAAVDAMNQQEYGVLPGVGGGGGDGGGPGGPNRPTKEDLEKVSSKEVTLEIRDGTTIEGFIKEINEEKDVVTIQDGRNSIVDVDMSVIEDYSVSEEPYFSNKHSESLRAENKATMDFRFSEKDIENYDGKFVEVNYDGKVFSGEVIGTHYKGAHDSGLIIQSHEGGDVKHIKNFRMTSIEDTGNTREEHENVQMMKFLESEVKDGDTVGAGLTEEVPETSETTPADELEGYFEARIRQHEGNEVNLDIYNHDWVSELESNSNDEEYSTNLKYGYDEEKAERYNSDMIIAEEANTVYEERKKQIDKLFDTVREVDWTKYGKSQKDGEVDALYYVLEGNTITD